jgi:putative acetyltransferase
MNEIRVRPFRPEDSAAVGRLFYVTVHTVNARDYSPAELSAWAPKLPNDEWALERAKTRVVLVAEDDSGLLGFAELRPDAGSLDCLYVRHDAENRGVGTALLDELETQARDRGVTILRVDASITARPFFEHRGYTVIAEQQVERSGLKLRNFRMEKSFVTAAKAPE